MESDDETIPLPLDLYFDRGSIVIDGAPRPEVVRRMPGGWRWDPRIGRFRALAHRLPEAADWLERRGVPYTYRSARPRGFAPAAGAPPPLRPYQLAALEAWTAAGRRGLMEIPTGAGKTRIAIAALLSLSAPALVVAPTRQLLHQWRAAIGEFYSGPIGIHGDGLRELEPITIATLDSAAIYLERFGDRFDLLIADEVHHLAAPEYREIPAMATARWRLGLSATLPEGPWARRLLEDLLGLTCFSLPVAQLAGTFLSDYEVRIVPVLLTRDERIEYDRSRLEFLRHFLPFRRDAPGGSWEQYARAAARTPEGRRALECRRRASEVLGLPRAKLDALDRLLELHAAEPMLVFTGSNRAAYEISRRFLIPAFTCDIGREERESILAGFQDGRIRALVSTRVLNEGIDVPGASCAVVLGGSASRAEHLQRLGRILRPRPGKRAVLYELVAAGTIEWEVSERRGRSDAFRIAAPL